MRTRNFRVRSEVVQRGSVTKSQKGKNAERKVEECFQCKAHGQCSKGASCSYDELAQGVLCSGQRQKKTIVFSCTKLERQDRRRGRKILKHKPRRKLFRQKEQILHVDLGILPYVKTTSLRPDAYMEENVSSDMLRQKESPILSRRKRTSC